MDQSSLNTASQAQSALASAQAASQAPPLPLAPLHLPTEPSIWPLAWGWWALVAIVVVGLMVAALSFRNRSKRSLAKNAALSLITKQATNNQTTNKKMAEVNNLLRQVCLTYYPRSVLASLCGEQWYGFLDNQRSSNKNTFQSTQHLWQMALYQKEPIGNEIADQLYRQVVDWINDCLPPSQKQLQDATRYLSSANSNLNGHVSAVRPVTTTSNLEANGKLVNTKQATGEQEVHPIADQQTLAIEPVADDRSINDNKEAKNYA